MASPTLDFRTTNTLWGSVLAETLVCSGVTQAVVSPGSRSTPLTLALVNHPGLEVVSVLDERSAAFFALGLAKRSGRTVVLVCTSGTAGANYFPAVIEAHESRVPLLVITADRPPELRDCASGQTIDQQKLFGRYAVFYHELAVPEARIELLRYLRQTVAHAVGCTADGPVHLNAPFRDPLAPTAGVAKEALAAKWDDKFFSHLAPPQPLATGAVFRAPVAATRGLIIAGPDSPESVTHYVTQCREMAAVLGWPMLADVLSPLRHQGLAVVTAYDAILRDEKVAEELRPDTVLCLGGWPTSKVLRVWLERSGAEVTLVVPGSVNRDALHGRTRHLPVRPEKLTIESRGGAGNPVYAKAWLDAETRVRARLDAALANQEARFEGKATWLLGRHLPEGTPVFVASSMPVRDAEYFWPANNRGFRFYFNRGANGIDGTLSTALGIAHGNRPAVLLTGDLALLHDTNGFLSAAKLRGSLTIVLINNEGGGIFGHLPIAEFDPPYEEYWATPQRVDFAKLCSAYGIAHVTVRDWTHFTELISLLPDTGVRVLEVCTDRKADAALRKKLFTAVSVP